MQTYSLYQLNEYINRVISLNFTDPIWITSEVSQCREVRGNFYLELIQKKDEDDQIIAQSRANIWYKNALFIQRKLGDWFYELLQEGMSIKCKVEVEYSERYGLGLRIVDIDPEYTVGKLAMVKAKILERLTKERLIERNKQLSIPKVLQKIAIISSSNAAGFQDFLKHLEQNIYQYKFELHLFEAAMQGQNVGEQVSEQLGKIANSEQRFDLITIVRGGGSKLDLGGFDQYEIGKAIGLCPIPVVTGIGHEIDQTIADTVAYQALKTPTAVADFIIEHNLNFEYNLIDIIKSAERIVSTRFGIETGQIQNMYNKINQLIQQKIWTSSNQLQQLETQVRYNIKNKLSEQNQMVSLIATQVGLLDPKKIFDQGYTISESKGKRINSVKQIALQEEVVTFVADGKFKSKITDLNKNP